MVVVSVVGQECPTHTSKKKETGLVGPVSLAPVGCGSIERGALALEIIGVVAPVVLLASKSVQRARGCRRWEQMHVVCQHDEGLTYGRGKFHNLLIFKCLSWGRLRKLSARLA